MHTLLVQMSVPALLSILLTLMTFELSQARVNGISSFLLLPSSSEKSTKSTCGPQLSIETPVCDVVEEKHGYELRQFPSGEMWATTVVANEKYSAAIRDGFYRCYYYISGENIPKVSVEMTAPVLIKPVPMANGYSISFFVPSRFNESSVPQPSNADMEIKHPTRSTKAVLGPFGGFPNDKVYRTKWEELKQLLENDEVRYDERSVTFVGYSSPFTIINRKQEVWVDIISLRKETSTYVSSSRASVRS